jgi:hypothetical protein
MRAFGMPNTRTAMRRPAIPLLRLYDNHTVANGVNAEPAGGRPLLSVPTAHLPYRAPRQVVRDTIDRLSKCS